ncbi:MAG: YraN family protein [Chloroflexota bacterium]|nr:YraN family protein [Chloroflexota bacterium]
MSPTPRRRLGSQGEGHARRYLERRGYRLLAANWHCAAGELDLVMRDGDEIVGVEVKTRRGEGAGRAEEAISPAQRRRLLAAAEWFLAEHPEWDDLIWRIDLVAITLDAGGAVRRVTHLPNVVEVS